MSIRPNIASNRRNGRRCGAAVVELAIISPIIVLIVMATIDLCSMYYLRQTCKLAAYEGCRIGLTSKGSNLLVENQAMRILHSRRITGYTITITPAVHSLTSDDMLRVSVSAPTNENLPLNGWLCGGGNITTEVAMQAEL